MERNVFLKQFYFFSKSFYKYPVKILKQLIGFFLIHINRRFYTAILDVPLLDQFLII